MARRALTKPGENYDASYQSYLVTEIEYRDGLSFKKGERIEANGGDQTEVVLVSPNGTKYKITVDNSGNLSTTQVA
jgi:hypothetical protein